MRKTTIVVDDDLLRRTSAVLGTHGLRATVDRSFREALALRARREELDALRNMEGIDLDNTEVVNKAWR